MFNSHDNGRCGGSRTRTGRILSPLSLPIGLRTHLLICRILFDLGAYYLPLGFDPNFCATWQRFVGRIYNPAWRGDCNRMTIIICLVGLDCNYRLTLSRFGIAPNFMLVYMDLLFHWPYIITYLGDPVRSGIFPPAAWP